MAQKYKIDIGGSIIYENNVPEDGELIPKNFVLLNGMLYNHDVHIIFDLNDIYFHARHRNYDLYSLFDLFNPQSNKQIFARAVCTEYSKDFSELLKSSCVSQIIRSYDGSNLKLNDHVIAQGMGGNRIHDFVAVESFNNIINKHYSNKNEFVSYLNNQQIFV